MSAEASMAVAAQVVRAAVDAARNVWDEARARHPAGTKLMRVIDLAAMAQHFDVMPAEGLHGIDLDGCTLIMPALARNEEERLLILQVYDRLWFETPDR